MNKIIQENNEVNYTWVLRYHKCFQLWITVKWPRSYILMQHHTCFHVLNVVRTSKILCLKMKVKTLREKIKESVQRTLCFRFIHENFFKSLVCISSKMFHTLHWNGILLVSWSSLQNSASFSVEQPKSAIKLKLLNWPPWITASARNNIPTCTWPSWSSLNYFLFACSTSSKEHKELGL